MPVGPGAFAILVFLSQNCGFAGKNGIAFPGSLPSKGRLGVDEDTIWPCCTWSVEVGCLLSLPMTILYADPNSSWKHLALLALIVFFSTFLLAPGFRVLCFSDTCAGPLHGAASLQSRGASWLGSPS